MTRDRSMAETQSTSGVLSSVGAAWVLSLGIDVLLHGGLLARMYLDPSPFLLSPDDAFRRIPLGYLAFLFLTSALYWLLRRLNVSGAVAGFRHGAAAGAIVCGAQALGVYSISTVTVPMLLGWWIGQTVELGFAGAVFGAAASGVRLKRIWINVAIAVIVCAIVTVALQSLGLAPPMKRS